MSEKRNPFVLLRRMVEVDPGEASEIDGDIHCHYCGACLEWQLHEDDCPWQLAKEWLEHEA